MFTPFAIPGPVAPGTAIPVFVAAGGEILADVLASLLGGNSTGIRARINVNAFADKLLIAAT